MKLIKLLRIYFLLSLFSCAGNALCDDITCPKDLPKKVNLKNINLKTESVSSKQELVKIEFDNKYLNKKFTSVILSIGEWKYNNKGELLSAVDIQADLEVDTKGKKSKVKFVKSKSIEDAVKVIITYGKNCGYWMEVDVK